MVESNAVGKTDEEMALAVENLSAMLGLDEVDKVIELLTANNWDESAAAQTYFAKQAQDELNRPVRPVLSAAELNQSIQTNYNDEDDGRPPMQEYQQD